MRKYKLARWINAVIEIFGYELRLLIQSLSCEVQSLLEEKK